MSKKNEASEFWMSSIRAAIDGPAWRELALEHSKSGWAKYFNLDAYLPYNLAVCERLGLIGAPRQRILDIGCGSGLFLAVARELGHDIDGIDVENDTFAAMAQHLGVPRRIAPIRARACIDAEGPFDLISAIGTQFDDPNNKTGGRWSSVEWRCFLLRAEQLLSSSGRVFLRINVGQEARRKGNYYYDAKVHAAMEHGSLRRKEYLFDRPSLALAIKNLGSVPEQPAERVGPVLSLATATAR